MATFSDTPKREALCQGTGFLTCKEQTVKFSLSGLALNLNWIFYATIRKQLNLP